MIRGRGVSSGGQASEVTLTGSITHKPVRGSGTFSALGFRNYRLFWFGQLVSVTGTFMQGTAQQWLVLKLASTAAAPLALGVVGALQFGPILFLGPFGGAIADRWPRRTVLVCTQVAAGILALVLFGLTISGAVQLWHVFVLALLLGFVNAVDMPTRQAFVTQLVPTSHLLNAVSLNSAQFNVSRIVGPGLAGLMIALFGTPLLFLLNGLSYVAVIIGLCMMRTRDLVPVPQVEPVHGFARVRQMGEGAQFVLKQPALRVVFLLIAIAGMMGFNFNVLLPLEATVVLHAGSAVFGLLSSALGAGALCGALLLARRKQQLSSGMLVATAAGFGVLEAGMALTRSVAFTMVIIAATGFVMSIFSASANTRVQLSTPPELRGRVMSVYMMLFAGTTPIGNLVVSSVASTAGVPLAFIVSGVPCVLSAGVAAVLWHRVKAHQSQQSKPVRAPLTGLALAAAVANDVAGATSSMIQPAQVESVPTAPIAMPTAPMTVPTVPTVLLSAGSSSGRMPARAPGHPAPQPRVADAD